MRGLGGLVVTGLIVGGLIGAAAVIGAFAPKDERKPVFDVGEGDLVQWQSMGKFIFPEPRKVVRVEEGEMGKYVFVEGSKTGIPIEQIVVLED
jgi:hypothetical protein